MKYIKFFFLPQLANFLYKIFLSVVSYLNTFIEIAIWRKNVADFKLSDDGEFYKFRVCSTVPFKLQIKNRRLYICPRSTYVLSTYLLIDLSARLMRLYTIWSFPRVPSLFFYFVCLLLISNSCYLWMLITSNEVISQVKIFRLNCFIVNYMHWCHWYIDTKMNFYFSI